MELLFGHSWWGMESYAPVAMIERIKQSGYDYAEIALPDGAQSEREMFGALRAYNLKYVVHQYQASGQTFSLFRKSYRYQLERAAGCMPLLINSHTGKDYFTFEENLALIDIASEISEKTGVSIVHETHRGRLFYSLPASLPFFEIRPTVEITADFSHWCCVSESLLQDQQQGLAIAIQRSRHIHARIGHTQGAQVSSPQHPRWEPERKTHLHWWKQIKAHQEAIGSTHLTITPEFGPLPYQWSHPSGEPIGEITEINAWMMQWLKSELET